MKYGKLIALFICLTMLFPVNVFALEGNSEAENSTAETTAEVRTTGDDDAWLAEDFTYGEKSLEQNYAIYPVSDPGSRLRGEIHVVTGFSESGLAKLEKNKALVIPAEDEEGTAVRGVGPSAFSGQGLTSVSFPEGVMADNEGAWDETVDKRGDFFIGSTAFSGNELTNLVLPEGVIYVGGNAFKNNKLASVSFPSTIMLIANQAFASNKISALTFTKTTVFPLQLDSMSFAQNALTEVTLPDKTDKVTKWAFFQNTGMEPVTSGTENEKKGGIVYFRIKDPGKHIDDVTSGTCNVQKLIVTGGEDPEPGEDDEEPVSWDAADFTYKEYSKLLYGCDYSRQLYINGKIVTGFSDTGEKKLADGNTELVIPSKTADGETVTGVGNGAFKGRGLTAVTFPSGMLVPYDDNVTQAVTRRGNFIIHENAFANNELTEVYLPAGVIACMSNAFKDNKITRVTLPRTIWWLETLAFANNEISRVDFPQSCDFRMEMHGMTFANNNITSVRLPDYTEVVNKDVFAMNPGMEPMTEEAAKKKSSADWEKYMAGGEAESGIVYMYTDRAALFDAQRIHTIDRPTKSQWSPFQKLVLISSETPDADTEKWNTADFTYDGTTVTGLTAAGKEKRKTNKILEIPDRTPTGAFVTEIASSGNSYGGVFGEEIRDSEGNLTGVEGFDVVALPSGLIRVGDRAFAELGLKEVVFPNKIEEIGLAAFQMNELEAVMLPDTVTSIGGGAFASNPALRQISIPRNEKYTTIEEGTFGCSDMKHWMTDLTSVDIPDTITEIRDNAFAGNNFETIEIPASVKSIGRFAFSTKNYLQTPTSVILHEGLETIGSWAFRNKKVENVVMPSTVVSLPANTFMKVDTDWDAGHGVNNPLVTRVFLPKEEQYNDKEKFPDSDWQKMYLGDPMVWTSEDYEYGEVEIEGKGKVTAVTGFSEHGLEKITINTEITLPVKDHEGDPVLAVAAGAFAAENEQIRLSGLKIPEGSVKYICDNAFKGNSLKSTDLGEGVETIGRAAFMGNSLTKVSLPKSLCLADDDAFAQNSIKTLEFAEGGSADLVISDRAFGSNKLKSLQLPDNLDFLSATAFADNPGATDEPGVVRLYKMTESGSELHYKSADSSECQDIIFGEIPPELAPWGPRHFTFSGDKITGFSADGEAKLAEDPYISLPGTDGNGTVITIVGERAFANYYGEENRKYGGNDPKEKDAIKGVEFADSIDTIKLAAFQQCAIEELALPDTVKYVEGGAFASNYGMKTITLSGAMTDIPDGVFVTNVTLAPDIEKLVIPEGVRTIGKSAFKGQQIRNLELPSSLTEIGAEAFFNHQLTSLEIPENVEKIGARAFEMRKSGATTFLRQLTLHEGLKEIGPQAFGQTELESVELPASLEKLPSDAFVDWKNNGRPDEAAIYLRTSNREQAAGTGAYSDLCIQGTGHIVVYDKMVGTGWDYDDFEYSDDGSVIIGWSDAGDEKRRDYAVKETYPPMVMPDRASYDSETDITEIGENAFQLELYNESTGTGEVTMQKFDCDSPYGIQQMVLPEKLTKIGSCAFEYNNLKAVDLESAEQLVSIGESAFHGNHLVTVVIPDRVKDLGGGAFAMNNIVSLTLSKNVTVIPQGCFSMNIRMSEVEIPDTVTEICEEAFAGARLETLEIPSSVKKIGKKAFHLHHLTTLHIPGNVKYIDDMAFEGTFKETTLTKLILDEGVEYIGRYAFKEALLEEVTLPNSLKDMGVDPFYNNKGKDGSGVVILRSSNRAHLVFNEDRYHGKEKGVSRHCHKVVYEGASDDAVAKGTVHKISAGSVKVTSSAGTVTFIKAANRKSVSVPGTVKINGRTFKVTGISAYAFKGSKATSVTLGSNIKKISANAFRGSKVRKLRVKTKRLSKKNVRNSLKRSKVRTIVVKVGKKSLNRKYIKKYKKIFTKKNAGKSVRIK